MTMPAAAQELGTRLPSPGERAVANQLRAILAARATDERERPITIVDREGKTADIVLAPGISELLMEVLRYVGAGDAVTLVPFSQMLTTQQAADILNVSRPFLISLLDRERIPFELVGRHRRIRAEVLFAYKRRRDTDRAEALGALAALDAELL